MEGAMMAEASIGGHRTLGGEGGGGDRRLDRPGGGTRQHRTGGDRILFFFFSTFPFPPDLMHDVLCRASFMFMFTVAFELFTDLYLPYCNAKY
jgi:hypothetical protein